MRKRIKRPLAYISGPMSSSGDRLQNLKNGMDTWYVLVQAGYVPITPHVHDFIDLRHEMSWKEWIDYDLGVVEHCDVVYRLPGFSRGADVETEFAKKKGIPVVKSLKELKKRVPV